MRNRNVLKITQAAMFLAVLIIVQLLTRSFTQYVTGSAVNLILVTAALTAGLLPALAVALVSPFVAFLLGIGPAFIQIVPFVALGNVTIVLASVLILGKNEKPGIARAAASVIGGSLAKFAVLYVGVVLVALSIIPEINPPQVEKMTLMFSWPQLVTALIGSSIAMTVVPMVRKGIRK